MIHNIPTIIFTVLFLTLNSIPSSPSFENVVLSPTNATSVFIVDDEGDGDYRTIHDALRNATNDTLIEVYSGVYYEQNLTINKSLILRGISHELGFGDDDGKPVIIGNNGPNSTIFLIEADQVNLSGLRIQNHLEISVMSAAIEVRSSDNITILENNISGYYYGIRLEDSNYSVIMNNSVWDNMYGIYLTGGSADQGPYYNPSCTGSSYALLNNNMVYSNKKRGIYLDSGTHQTLRNNTMMGNNCNFGVFGSNQKNYEHNIDTSNRVESKPLYYLVNQHNQSIPHEAGCIILIQCKNITVQDALLTHNQDGILLFNTTESQIENVTTEYNIAGISCYNSTNITITHCQVINNELGICLSRSDHNDVVFNTITRNMKGVFLKNTFHTRVYGNIIKSSTCGFQANGLNNTVLNNTFCCNRDDIGYINNIFFSNNSFYDSLQNTMITYEDIDALRELNDEVSINFSVFYLNHTPYYGDNYQILLSPTEPITINHYENRFTCHFRVTQLGSYSVTMKIVDEHNNTAEKTIMLYVNTTGSSTTQYYLRCIDTTHGQPRNHLGYDAYSLQSTPPQVVEEEFCGLWVQNSPDNLPTEYPFSTIKDITISSWCRFFDNPGFTGMAVQRYVTFDSHTWDQGIPLDSQENYTWMIVNFSDLNWSMEYQWSWYWFAVKLTGGNPHWMTNHERPSVVNITHIYTTTPAIQSVSSLECSIYSATSPANNTNRATIVLAGSGTTNLVVQMPNTSLRYLVLFDGIICNTSMCCFTQQLGQLNFSIEFEAERIKHTLDIIGIQVNPEYSYVTLTADNLDGLTTCPAGDGYPYHYCTVTCLDENREPLPGIPAEEWEFTLIDTGAVYWYGDLSCTFTAVNPTTDEQGMLSFSITGDTAIVGDLGIQATIMGVSLQDTDILPCQSPDYFCDGSVQSGDFVLFGQDWTHDVPRSDFDWSSGPINALDFIFFGQHWGHHY